MLKRFAPLTALIAALALSGAAWAHPVAGFIEDIEGDANLLNGQGLIEIVAPDPTGQGVATAPASYGPADLRAIDLKTTFNAIPVGDDGIDYQATGVQVIVKTETMPMSDGPTLIYRVNANVDGCNSFLQAFLRGPAAAPTDPAEKAIQWRQLDSGCPDGVATTTMPFPATVSAEESSLTMNFEYSKLTPAQRAYLDPGSFLMTVQGSVRTQFGVLTAPQIDQTIIGDEWEVGSDMPADVPCTTNCP